MLAAAGCSASCTLDSNFSDLGEKLLDPEVQGLNVPGERLLVGPHVDLSIQADETGARFALARNAESELSIIDFSAKTQCRTGSILRYDDVILAPGQPALIPLLVEDETDGVHLTFSNFACERSAFEIAANNFAAETIKDLSEGSGTSVLFKTPERRLLLVDPWAQTTRQLAESVRSSDPLQAFGHWVWVDRGVIVISDPALEPLAYYGEGVSEFNVSAEDAELAYIEGGTEAGAGGTLFVVDATSQNTPREMATEACSVSYLTIAGRRQLAYLSPCRDRRLVFQDRADASVRVISEHVADGPALRNIAGQSFMTYATNEDRESSSGTLWLVRGDAAAVALGENARVRPSAVSPSGGLLSVLDLGSTGGRLVEWKDDATREVARDVVELNSVGALADGALTFLGNFNGETGDLLRLNADLSTNVIASGVPQRAAATDVFLANFSNDLGELLLLDRANGTTELLGSGVARSSFGYALQFDGVIMLTDRDIETNTSTLRLRLLDSGRQYLVHTGVTETREVAFPSPGLLYNVVVGDDAGVWFSKAL